MLTSKIGRRVLLAAAGIIMWHAWLNFQAAGKVPDNLAAYVSPRGTVDVRVTLRFPPERFHVLMMQRFGRVSGTEGDTIEVRSVPVERVGDIARFYWVRAVVPFKE